MSSFNPANIEHAIVALRGFGCDDLADAVYLMKCEHEQMKANRNFQEAVHEAQADVEG